MVSSISTLMALCEKADNDIRACLNTLQVPIPLVLIKYIVVFCFDILNQCQVHIHLLEYAPVLMA